MNRLEKIIEKNILKHKHFEEYFKIIKMIRDNRDENPDISIESCKSLVEGISKTIILNLDKSHSLEKIDKYDLPKLFKESVKVLSLKCEEIEEDFIMRFSTIIQVLGEIRNKRGDISHGRMAPKQVNSSSEFASTISYMTESILYYILEHYFNLDLEFNSSLEYEKMKVYNDWLDHSVEFPLEKVNFSKILFDYDNDSYENRYNDEYLRIEEDKFINGGIKFNFNSERIDNSVNKYSDSKKNSKEIKDLTNDFDSESFWTKERNGQLDEFAINERLDSEGLKDLINKNCISDKTPIRDEIAAIMVKSPSLKDRKVIVDIIEEKIKLFIKEL